METEPLSPVLVKAKVLDVDHEVAERERRLMAAEDGKCPSKVSTPERLLLHPRRQQDVPRLELRPPREAKRKAMAKILGTGTGR